MKHILSFLFISFLSFPIFSQTLIINEISQGPTGGTGVKEYVELLVIPTSTTQNCDTCMDLRGWIFDDNSGYFSNGVTSGTGVAAGAVRFSTDAIWSCVPFGTLIVIYNPADVNAAIPVQDISLTDNNCRLVLPVNSNLLEFQTLSPGNGNTIYPTTGWIAGGSLWNPLGMSNSDDSFQIYAPTNTLVPTIGVSWGNNNSNNIIYFAGGSSNTVFYFANTNSNDPLLQSNWLSGTCSSPDNQTPGLPNNPANENYINQLNNSCSIYENVTSTSVITDETCNCNGAVTITPTGGIPDYTYSWTNASNTVIGQTATLSNLCAGTYSCEVRTLNGCIYDTTIVIPSNPNTTIPTFTQIAPTCVGDVFSLPTTSTNNITGTWSPAPNFAQTTTYTFTPTNTSCPTNATMTVVVDPCGLNQETCFKTVTFTQVIASSCLVGADSGGGAEDPALSIWCDNSLSTLLFGTEWTLNIPSANTYNLPNPWSTCQQGTNTWSLGAIPSDVQSLNIFVQTYESDDSNCENPMSNGDGCRSSANHTMDLTLGTHVIDIGGELSYRYTVTETTLVSNVTLNNLVCNGNTYEANLTVNYLSPNTPCGLGGTLGNLIVNGQQFTVTTSPQTITLTNLPANGQAVNINAFFDGEYSSCQYNATNVFTAPVPPTLVSFTGNGDYCTSETPNNVQVNITGSTPFSATYTLDGVSNTVQSNTNPFSLGNLEGEYILTQITAGGCSTAVDDTVEITVSSSIAPNFTQIGPFCVGDVFTLPNTSTNGIQGVWSPAINSTQTTTYIFTPVNNNCSSTTTMEVVINSNVTPTFTPINPICINAIPPNLPTSSTNGISGTWSPSTISTTTAGNFYFTFSPSSGQCAIITDKNIIITNPITPNFSAIGPFCINSTPTNLPNQSVEGISGTWNPAIINTTALGTAIYTFTPSSGFCATTYEASIFIGDNLVNAGLDQTVCEGDTVTLSAQGTAPFLWNNGVDDNVPFVVNQTTIYTVSSTQNGCTATDNVTVNVIQNPNVDFTITPITGSAPLPVTFTNETINGTTYTWDFGNGNSQNINSNADVTQLYTDGGVYTITLFASTNGCSDSISYNLIVLPDPNLDFNVPNVFSPNDDLSNDVYSLNFENAIALNAIIVNRWGNVVFTFTSPLQTWDGTSNGLECPEGVYFVKYEVTAINNEIFKGQQFIHLVR